MARQFYNRGITRTLAAIILVIIICVSSGAAFYAVQQQTPQEQPVNATASPTPTQTQPTEQPKNTSTPTPTTKATKSPVYTSQPSSAPTSTPKGLLDDVAAQQKIEYQNDVHAANGNWSSDFQITPTTWTANTTVRLAAQLNFSQALLTSYLQSYPNPAPSNSCLLITAERDFDPSGYQHTPWDESVSTILTPSGLPIEGGGSAAISSYTGYTQKTPVDVMVEVPLSNFKLDSQGLWNIGNFYANFTLPANLPSGIYRLRLDFGFRTGSTRYDLNGDGIGTRPKDLNNASCVFSPPITASGYNVNGSWVDGSQIARKSYWVLLWDYNSNGYRGVVAHEDQNKVAISPRNLIHDEIILPRYSTTGSALYYNIEPMFLLDNTNPQRNIPWNYHSGNYSVKITYPNGTVKDLGTAAFTTRRGNGATTANSSFTSWKPQAYGNYTIEASGWIEDIWGNKYYGGGNYTFYIAERLTLATATFQGQPYNVGNRYGRDMAFNPPCPANVTIKANLYAYSDPNNVTTVISTGQATDGGLFGAAQGLKPLTFTVPGEYYATVLATYWDSNGTLWVSAMTHAGVVYPLDSSIEAHGKKLALSNGTLVDRGQQGWEGYTLTNGTSVLDHINFPYNQYDVLEIASEQQGSNKIEPVLTYKLKSSNASYDTSIQSIGRSNIIIKTSNSYSPEMFPEYITDMQYYYGSAPRPGFNSRFIVSHDNIRAPYWPTSPNSFGGEIGASNNGDMPGDIYRLIGGVVLRNKGQAPVYAGYQANAFILPKGTNNNRIVGPGDENLQSPDGVPARFFLVPIRPGSVFPVGYSFGAVLQIDPVVNCSVRFTLTAPNGTTFTTTGFGDQYGYFAAANKWILDQPGVWTYQVNATWNGYQGKVPGLPADGGWIYVIENGPPPATGMTLKIPAIQTFSPTAGLNITGNSTAQKIYYAAIIPGAVLEEGTIPVTNGTFLYTFDPQHMADKIKTYDIVNQVNGKAEIGRVVHLTFFSEEQGPNGTTYHSFARVVLRGTIAVYIKER